MIRSQSIRIVQSVPPESRGLSSTRRTRPPDSDFVKLIGEVVSVEQGLIPFTSRAGKGTIKVNEVGYAEPYRGATGCATRLMGRDESGKVAAQRHQALTKPAT